MTTTIRTYLFRCAAAAALFSLVLCTSSVQAGLVTFDDIHQSTQTPGDPPNLYGAANTAVPNKLIFAQPNSFAATAIGSGGVDVTDGFLSFSVAADPLTWATGLSITEGGSWSLIPPIAGNIVGVRGSGFVTITEVDGLPVAGPVLPIQFEDTFDSSDTPPDSQNWSLNFAMGFAPPGGGKVTGFDVALNNRLFALSEQGFSFIDKKRIEIMVRTEMVPEPSTALLGFIAMSGLGLIAGRRRG